MNRHHREEQSIKSAVTGSLAAGNIDLLMRAFGSMQNLSAPSRNNLVDEISEYRALEEAALLKILNSKQYMQSEGLSVVLTVLKNRGYSFLRKNLTRRKFLKTDLSNSYLQKSDFTACDLRFIDVSFSSLVNANLTNTNLLGANFGVKAVLSGHKDNILSLCYDPVNNTVASADREPSIKEWALETYKMTEKICDEMAYQITYNSSKLYFRNDDNIIGVISDSENTRVTDSLTRISAFAVSSNFLFYTLEDGTVIVADHRNGQELLNVKAFSSWVFSISVSPDENFLAAACQDHSVSILNLKTKRLLFNDIFHEDWVYSVDFSSSGQLLASAGKDSSVFVIRVQSGQVTKKFKTIKGPLYSVKFIAGQSCIAAGGENFYIWALDSEELLYSIQGSIRTFCVHEPYFFLATGKFVQVWEINKIQNRKIEAKFYSMALSSDCRYLAVGSNMIQIWELCADKYMKSLDTSEGKVRALAFTQDDVFLASAHNQSVYVWITSTWEFLYSIDKHSAIVSDICFLPSSSVLVSAGWDSYVYVWDLRNQSVDYEFKLQDNYIFAIDVSPSGQFIAASTDKPMVAILDLENQSTAHSFEFDSDWVLSLKFSPDGTTLMTACKNGIVNLINLLQGTSTNIVFCEGIRSLAYSRNGLAFASAGDNINLYANNSQANLYLSHGMPTDFLAFANDDEKLVAISNDGTIMLWRANSLNQ